MRELEPEVVVRSLAFDCERPRLLATVAAARPEHRPRVVRIDPPAAEEALLRAAPLVAWLGEAIVAPLARRPTRP